MIRTKGEAGTGDVVEAVRHARTVLGEIRLLQNMPEEEFMAYAKTIGAPYELVMTSREVGRMPVVNFAAGGESTTIGKLMMDYGLFLQLREFANSRAVWGTCAGAILLARDAHRKQPLLELMDISVERNAFGSQANSFAASIDISSLSKVVDTSTPFNAIFIRAPVIKSVSGNAKVLSHIAG